MPKILQATPDYTTIVDGNIRQIMLPWNIHTWLGQAPQLQAIPAACSRDWITLY